MGKLGLVLMGMAMLSKSLIEFSVDGWSYVLSLIFTWGQSQTTVGFPGGSEDEASVCNAGDPGSIPGLGRPPGEGNGNPLQYSCLENSMNTGAWWATVQGFTEWDTVE